MKNALWFVLALGLFAVPFAAEAQFPRPRPAAPAPVVVDPAPPPIPAPPVVNVPAPQVTVTPTLSVPDPTPTQSFLQWLNAALGTLIAGFLAKIAFKPAAAGAPGGGLAVPAGVADLLAKAQDPAVRAMLDAALLRAVQSGVPGTLIQSGASLIPGVGPAAAGLEPLLRQAVIDILQRQHGTVALPAPATIDGSANPPPPPAQVDVLGNLIAGLTKTIESRFPPHTA